MIVPAPPPALVAQAPTDATLRKDLAHLAAAAGGRGGFVVLDGRSGGTRRRPRPTSSARSARPPSC
jgi:hypothetical protein